MGPVTSPAIRVGRLLEIRAQGYRSAGDVKQLFAAIGNELKKLPAGVQVVTVTDWRYCPLMSEEASEALLASITGTNPRVLRSGALASKDSSVTVLQFVRLVRESKHESRRLFFDQEALTSWLGEVLTPAEKTRLTTFLNERFGAEPGCGTPHG